MSNSEKRENALSAIEAGKIKMRPKWHFVLKTALMVVGTILALLALLFLASFIIFMLRRTGLWFLPGFGGIGFFILLRSLPWVLILLVIVFGIILEILVRQYSFGYGRPLLYSAIGVILVAVLGGLMLEMTPLHRGLYASARNNRLPIGGVFYQRFGGGMPMGMKQKIIAGNIVSVTSTGFVILTPREEEILLVIDANTQISTSSDYKEGDAVVAFIRREGDIIKLERIRKIDDEIHFPRERRGPGMRPMMRVIIQPTFQ